MEGQRRSTGFLRLSARSAKGDGWNYPEVANSFLLRDRNPLHCSFFIIRGAQVA